VKARRRLRRYHIWLGWIVGLPLLMWTVTGLFMVARPIGEVRGEGLLAQPRALALTRPPVPPRIGPRPVASLTLEQRSGTPTWAIRYADGGGRLADAATGRLLPPLSASDAAAIVRARYAGKAAVAAVDRTTAEAPPLDLRRPVATWRVTMSDGTRFYLDAATGQMLATRTRFWRAYDVMWGLHILDPAGRENSHNPFVIGFAAVSLLTVSLALILLPMTLGRRGRP
jgi:uncharacterized iron-regulated membrane protein